jgi:CheY-like chemotaxis protein
MTAPWPTILVVDDEPLNLMIIEEFLDGHPVQLVLRTSGRQAWDELRADPQRFSAVLLDRMMPDLDGIELLAMMRQDAHLAGIPVVLQSASAKQVDVADGIRAGAVAYLTKPFSPEDLHAALSKALASRTAPLR